MVFSRLSQTVAIAVLVAGMSGCGGTHTPGDVAKPISFGKMPDGTEVFIYTLKNRAGMEVRITNYGGIVVSLRVPDRSGSFDDVVLGYDSLAGYLKETPYFGALIGRYGNRIRNGKFVLDGREYVLATNNGPNHLHGGLKGFDKVVWKAEAVHTTDGPSLVLTYVSKDGEEGYPGTLAVKAVYTVTESNELTVDFNATTDRATVVNLTHHTYFNLAGANGNSTILGHLMMIDADRFTPVDSTLIPTGVLQDVTGTPMDFRTPIEIGARINGDDVQLKRGGGYDHNWVLNNSGKGMRTIARVTEPVTGRVLEVKSAEPGLQFYSGNFLDGTLTGKYGRTYVHRYGLCLEPQHFPNSPNEKSFPTVVVRPGETYTNHIVYAFSAK
jgi:aldose 1-epimerase